MKQFLPYPSSIHGSKAKNIAKWLFKSSQCDRNGVEYQEIFSWKFKNIRERKTLNKCMHIFENREDQVLQLSREEQVPLAKVPHWQYLMWPISALKEELPLDTFPLIEDFEVVLLPMPSGRKTWRQQWGYHLGFFSQQQGLLASFGLNGAVLLDYSQEDFPIPVNFYNWEQAWEQAIFEKDNYIYVLEGDFDDHASGYHCWFRVRKERYLTEWQSALEACRQIIRPKKRK